MNTDKLINILKMGSITVPFYLLKNYSKLNINTDALILLAYLLDKTNTFDCKKIAEDLNIKDKEVLERINELSEKGLISICVGKNNKGVVEETISLDPLYHKLSLILIEDNNEKEPKKTSIYEIFEKELGRTLSPMEYEIISSWLESKYDESIIIEALKEAVFNGANNLRYIDKILFEWNRKGFKNINDIHKDRERYIKSKKDKIEIPDYNWLEENE